MYHSNKKKISEIEVSYKMRQQDNWEKHYVFQVHTHPGKNKRTNTEKQTARCEAVIQDWTQQYEFMWRQISQQHVCQSPPQGISSGRLFLLCLLRVQGMNRIQAVVNMKRLIHSAQQRSLQRRLETQRTGLQCDEQSVVCWDKKSYKVRWVQSDKTAFVSV